MGNRQSFNYSQIELTTLIEQRTDHILLGSQLYRSSLNDYYLKYKQRCMPSEAIINFSTKYIKNISKPDSSQEELSDQISIVPVLHYEQNKNSHLCIQQKQFVFIFPYYNWTLDKYLTCTSKNGKPRTDQILYVLQQMLKILIKLQQEGLRLALFRNGTKQIYLNLKGRPCLYLLAYQEEYQQQNSGQNSMTRLSTCLLESLTKHALTSKNKRCLPTLVEDKRIGDIFKTLLQPIQLQKAKQVFNDLRSIRKQYPLKMKALGRKRLTQTSINPTPTKRRRSSFILSSRIRHNQQDHSPMNISGAQLTQNDRKQKLRKSYATAVGVNLNVNTFETEKKQCRALRNIVNQIPNKTVNLSVNDFSSKGYDTANSFYDNHQKRTDQPINGSIKKQDIWKKAVVPIERSLIFSEL